MTKTIFAFLMFVPFFLLSQQSIESEGGIKIANVSNDDLEGTDEGTIRYNAKNKDFEGWNGTNWISLTTGLIRGSVKDIDGKEYETVIVGDQEWMAENLATIHFRNGDLFSFGLTDSQWSNLTTSALSFVNDDSGNTDDYGILYNYFAAIDPRGICPVGFEIPTQEQWEELRAFLGGSDLAGIKIKEQGLEHWVSKTATTGLENISGLNGRGAGIRDGSTGDYQSFLFITDWWSKTEFVTNPSNAISARIVASDTFLGINAPDKRTGLPIRCIKK